MESFDELVERFGWAIIGVGPSGPDQPQEWFTYSVGAGLSGLPDVLIFGLSPKFAHPMLNHFLDSLRSGDYPVSQEIEYTHIANLGVFLRRLSPEQSGEYMFKAHEFYQKRSMPLPDMYQIVFPDKNRKLPWEEGYDCPQQRLAYLEFPATSMTIPQGRTTNGR